MGLADETVADAADGPYHAPRVGGASLCARIRSPWPRIVKSSGPGPHPRPGSSLPGSQASLAAAIGSILPVPAAACRRPRNAAAQPGGLATSGLPGFRLVTVQEVNILAIPQHTL